MLRLMYSVVVLVWLSVSGCGFIENSLTSGAETGDPYVTSGEWNKSIPGGFSSQCKLCFDTTQVSSFLKSHPKFKAQADDIRKFYRGRMYTYAWFDENGLIEQAGNLTNRIQNLQFEGKGDAVPYYNEFDSLMTEVTIQQAYQPKPDPNAELMLTAVYFAFSKSQGIKLADLNEWFTPRKKQDYNLSLDVLLKEKDTIANHEPLNRQYEQLRAYLVKYHHLELEDPWPRIVPDRMTYMVGDVSPVIGEIRKRLHLLGDLPGDSTSFTYNQQMKDAVLNFQHRHGLKEDGIIGSEMIKALNVTPAERIKTLMVNMERCKWVPVSAPRDHIIINIPEFELHVYQKDSLIWSCKVIVGEVIHKTVVFNGDIKYVIFSPYWNVPYSISKNEYAGKGKDFYEMMNMDVLGYNDNVPILRQRPGPGNALGQVKFVFPNSHSIYLHDTPMKPLFDRTNRTFSHGCIRISEPKKLAMWLLRNDKNWDEFKIEEAMEAGTEKTVTLKNPVPVSIAYFTAFVDEKGRINFRKDVYGRDTRMDNTILDKELK